MGRNSILSNTTAQNAADGIRQDWNHYSNEEKQVVVIVEGKNDLCLYRNFMKQDRVRFEELDGCEHHKEVFDRLNGYGIPVIGIRDADFNRLNGTIYVAEGYFYTDTHDREMDFYSHHEWLHEMALNKVESLRPDHNLSGIIFGELEVLSKIRWYNEISGVKYKFDGFPLMKHDGNWLKDFNNVHSEVMARSVSGDGFRNDLILTSESYSGFSSTHTGPFSEITNGHDFSQRLRYHLASSGDILEDCTSTLKFKKFQTTEDDFEVFFRLAYTIDKFKQTNLYASIKDWETNHSLSFLK